jgi:DNA-directed RNA polymerase specialized sigma24 family protein
VSSYGAADATAEQARNATAAVTDLFREHHLGLVRMAIVMVGDPATAEDVVQDAFERLHRRWPRLPEPVDGLAYVRASVLNGCRSVHRRAAVARKHAPRLARTGAAALPRSAAP